MCSCDVSGDGGEENKPRGMTVYTLLRSGYVVGLVGAGGSGADCSSSKYEEKRACKTASARRSRARFTTAAATAAAGGKGGHGKSRCEYRPKK